MKSELTQKLVKNLLRIDYSSIDGKLIWKIDVRNNGIKSGSVAGCKNHQGYIVLGIMGTVYYAQRVIWLIENGYFPENDIDHIDKIKHHNHPKNLREVSRSCNMRNYGNPSDNTSGIRGIDFHKQSGKWRVRLNVYKTSKNLGLYKKFHNAVCARLAGEQCVGWSECDSSSPAYQYVQNNIIKKGA